MTTHDLQRELDVAIHLAHQAGRAIMDRYQTGLDVELKAGDEPVTAADHVADALIREGLRAAFPGDGLLTEESEDDLSRLERSRVWIVDPLDGTTEFINETGDFVVQIALTVKGEPVLGVVYHPVEGQRFQAVRGQGTFRVWNSRSERLHVSTTVDPAQMCLVASRSHYSDFIERAREVLGVEAVHRTGSVGLKAGQVASGACDLYLSTSVTKEWDICAPHIVLAEAGGVLTDLCGEPLTYNKAEITGCRGLVGSNGRAHAQVVEAIAPLLE